MWLSEDGRLNTVSLSSERIASLAVVAQVLARLSKDERLRLDEALEIVADEVVDVSAIELHYDLAVEASYEARPVPEEYLEGVASSSATSDRLLSSLNLVPLRWRLDVVANIQQVLAELD